MRPLTQVTGPAAILDRENVDTEQIIPKQFLKRIERTGYGEFLFFALNLEGPGVCGKAWHHEDRTDPGNHISKHYVRLQIKDGDLWLSDREQEDVDPSDPELINMAVTGGSAETCMADKAPATEWSPWVTYIFAAESKK